LAKKGKKRRGRETCEGQGRKGNANSSNRFKDQKKIFWEITEVRRQRERAWDEALLSKNDQLPSAQRAFKKGGGKGLSNLNNKCRTRNRSREVQGGKRGTYRGIAREETGRRV